MRGSMKAVCLFSVCTLKAALAASVGVEDAAGISSNQIFDAMASAQMAEAALSNGVESVEMDAAPAVDRLIPQSEEQRIFQRANGGTYIEFASGLNYQDEAGAWKSSRVAPKTTSNGSVTFDELPVQHIFAPWSGQRVVVESSRRGGSVAKSALGGLSYYDLSSGKSALIAWVTNSPVQAYDGGVFYERAFLGVDADILYKVHPWGLEQDVVIFGGLPDPKAFGMDPAQTKLCALTELVDFDLSQAGVERSGDVEPAEPAVASLEVSTKQGSDWSRLYNWQPGYAYPEERTLMIGAGDAGDQAQPVAMRLFSAMGRVFLSEEVPLSHVSKSMPELLDARLQEGVAQVERIEAQSPLALPPVRSDEKLVADQSPTMSPQAYIRRAPRYVLDYVNYYGTNTTGVTFASGQTYYISAPYIVSGGKVTIQPGAILKLATGSYVKVQGSASLECRSHAISPAYFTSAYDTNLGEVVLSGAAPLSNLYAKGLSIWTASNDLRGLVFRYAKMAVELYASGNHKIRDVQILNSDCGIYTYGYSTNDIRNLLIRDGSDGVQLYGHNVVIENCTFQAITNRAIVGMYITTNISVKNSLFYDVKTAFASNGYYQTTFAGNAAYNVTTGWMGASVVSLASNTFAVGPYGSNYLVVGSAAINAGTTNADLLGLYHYTTATNGMKETNSLVDIGFHYGTSADQDGDGMPDCLEDRSGDGSYASNSTDISDWNATDTDGDGLSDSAEYFTHGTNPKSSDTDNDGLSDALEVQNGSNPLDAGSTLWSLSGTVSYSGIQTGTLHVLVTSYEPLTNRPAMDYSFDEDRVGYTPDISGSGREGTIYGATWKTNGVKGGCYTFDGNDRITLGGLDAANGSYNLTWTAWMRYTGGGVLGGMLGNTAAGNEGIMLMKGGENLRASVVPQSRAQDRYAEVGNLVTQDIWQLVSGTYNGTQTRLYLNGELVATSAVYSVEPIHSNSLNATIGDVTDGRGWYFYGDLDEVRIYQSTFTTNQMKSLFFEMGGSVIRRDWTTNILAASTDFAVPNLPSGSNYWLTAWRDVNGNGRMDYGEAQGRYSGYVGNLSGNSNSLAITLADPDLDLDGVGDGVEILAGTDPRSTNSVPVTAAGQVIYSGGQTGPIYITARPYENITDTPLLCYSFNTSNSTIVLDESGNGITGILSNAKWTSGGIRSGAYRFDGNSYINLGDLSAVEGRTGLTWGAWVNQAYGSSLRGIMGKMVSYGESFLLVSTPSSGSLNAQVVPQSRAQARDAAVNGVATGMVWQYVAGTYDGQQTRLYLDGQLIATSPVYAVEGIFSNNTVAAVGDVAVGRGWYMNGRLDDVHIYGRCFNTNEIYSLAASIRPENIIRVITNTQPGAFAFTNLPNARKYWFEAYRDSNGNGLRDSTEAWVAWSNNPAFLQSATTNIILTLAEADSDQDGIPDWWEIKYGFNPTSSIPGSGEGWWKFDETSGTNAANSAGSGYGGQLVNMGSSSWVTGVLGRALQFDGSSGYVRIVQSPAIITGQQFSVSAWAWLDSTFSADFPTILSDFRLCGSSYPGFWLGYDRYVPGTAFLAGDCSEFMYPNSSQSIAGKWVHVVGTYNGTASHLYLDGIDVASAANDFVVATQSEIRIGWSHDPGYTYHWKGQLDDVRLYKSWLASNEVFAMYDALKDPDGDGLSNIQEFQAGTKPNTLDTDGDGLPDGWEIAKGLNPLSSAGENGASGDPDQDLLTNMGEYQQGTDPFDFDTDDDLLADGPELTRYQTSPTNIDSDGDTYYDSEDSLIAYYDQSSQTALTLWATLPPFRFILYTVTPSETYEFYYNDDLVSGPWLLAETAISGESDGVLDWYNYETGPGRKYVPGRAIVAGYAADTDGDGIGSGYEVGILGTSPDMYDSSQPANGISDGDEDFDGDGLCNAAEYNSPAGSYYNACQRGSPSPWRMDTDGDGVSDGPVGNGTTITNGPDAFPLDPYGWRDLDCDGQPDGVNNNFASNSEPPLSLDADSDNDGLADASDSEPLIPRVMALVNTVNIQSFSSSYRTMSLVGSSPLSWDTSQNNMRQIGDHLWEYIVDLNSSTGFAFKIVSNGDWNWTDWGLVGHVGSGLPQNGTATAEASGDIHVTGAIADRIRLQFNASTREYLVEKYAGALSPGGELFDGSSRGGYLPYATGSNAKGFGRVFGGIYFNYDANNLYVCIGNTHVEEGNVLLLFLDTKSGGPSSMSTFSGSPDALGIADNLSFGSGFNPDVALVLGRDFGDGWNIVNYPSGFGQGIYDISSGTSISDFSGFSGNSGGGLISQWGDKDGYANAGIEVALSRTALGLNSASSFKAAAIFAGGSGGCSGGNRWFSSEAYGASATSAGFGCAAVTLTGADVFLSTELAPSPMSISQSLYTDQDVMLQGFYFDVPQDIGGHQWYRELRYKVENTVKNEFSPFSMIWLPPPQKGHWRATDAGYAPFDHYDIGTYLNPNSVNRYTRYGTEAELIECVAALKAKGQKPIVDLVMNHMFSGNVSRLNFTYSEHDLFEKPDPGQNNGSKYFSAHGTTNTPFESEEFFTLEGPEVGRVTNYYSDVNQRHLYMRRGLETWGNWLTTKVGYQGYRFDVAQFIQPGFLAGFLGSGLMNQKFSVFEYWVKEAQTSPREMQTWLGLTENRALIYDGVLRDMLTNMCANGDAFNIETLFKAGLSGVAPGRTMNYVDNHDTFRPRNGLGWEDADKKGAGPYKALGYAFIMMAEGLPMVFWPDYFSGIQQHASQSGFNGVTISNQLVKLIWVRTNFVSGTSLYRSTANKSNLFVLERLGDGINKDGCLLAINDHSTTTYSDAGIKTHWLSETLVNITNVTDTLDTDASGAVISSLSVGPRAYKVYVELSKYSALGGPPP